MRTPFDARLCSIHFKANGKCEDGGEGSQDGVCSYGSDCTDCGIRLGLSAENRLQTCKDDCMTSDDGDCDDGGGGASYSLCSLGTDCGDCGDRFIDIASPPPFALPAGWLCSNTCSHSQNGGCDDGGPESRSDGCAWGTDCYDCGPRPAAPPPSPPPPPPPSPRKCSRFCTGTCKGKMDKAAGQAACTGVRASPPKLRLHAPQTLVPLALAPLKSLSFC